MASCDICGKKSELYRAIVEDVELLVCEGCSAYGKVLGKVNLGNLHIMENPKIKTEKSVQSEIIVGDYQKIIKNARESLGMTQKDFSRKISEKESTIHKIETGAIKPSILLARKLEKILKIRLIEPYKEEQGPKRTIKTEGMTIGDFIKIRN